MGPTATLTLVRASRFWVGLGVMLTASCLLTTSLDGLEGPPLLPDGGAGGGLPGEGSAADIGDASFADGGAGGGGTDTGSDSGGQIEDAPILDGGDGGKGPDRVATASGVRGIAVYGDEIYWVQTAIPAGIAHASKLGGMPVLFENTSNAFDVAVDGDYVYWSTGQGNPGNEVYRKPINMDGSSGASYFTGPGATLYLVVGTAGRVFVTGNDTVAFGPKPDAGTSIALYLTQPGVAGIAIHNDNIFWSRDTGIVFGSEKGQVEDAADPVYLGMPGEVAGIATDGQEVYWIGSDGAVRAISLRDSTPTPREVCRAHISTGDAESDVRLDGDGGASAMADVAVDEQWVYFAEPALRQISKCRKH